MSTVERILRETRLVVATPHRLLRQVASRDPDAPEWDILAHEVNDRYVALGHEAVPTERRSRVLAAALHMAPPASSAPMPAVAPDAASVILASRTVIARATEVALGPDSAADPYLPGIRGTETLTLALLLNPGSTPEITHVDRAWVEAARQAGATEAEPWDDLGDLLDSGGMSAARAWDLIRAIQKARDDDATDLFHSLDRDPPPERWARAYALAPAWVRALGGNTLDRRLAAHPMDTENP